MAKKLSVKVGEFTKDGQTKGRYVNIGVIMQSSDGGEYILLDPTVSLAGVMQQQNTLAMQKNEQLRDRIMVGVFEEEQQGYNQQQNSYQQQQQPQQPKQQYQQQTPQGQQYGNGVNNPNDPPF